MSSGNTQFPLLTRTMTIDTDLSDKMYHFVKLDSDDNVVVATANATAIPFVLLEDGNGATTPLLGSIAMAGVVKIKLGGTVAQGDKLTATTGGKAIATTTDGDLYGLVALTEGVADDIIEALVSVGCVYTA